MHPYQAYHQQQSTPMPRIDLILAVFRKALDLLHRARQALQDNRQTDARLYLSHTQLLVSSLAAGDNQGAGEVGANFLRLYEFVGHCLETGAIQDLDSAEKVLRTLFEGFATVRHEAVALEMQGKIPPLEKEHQVQVNA